MNTIPYRIHEIKTTQFATFPEKYINGGQVSISTTFHFALKKDIPSVLCSVEVNYSQDENLLLIAQVDCVFAIEKDAMSNLQQEGKISVTFLRYLGTIATGTLRGIIHAKTEGSVLNGLVLPPLNLNKVINQDFIFDKSTEVAK